MRRGGDGASHRYPCPRLLPQSRRLPVGLSGPYSGPRIHPLDRGRALRRCLSGQLEVQCISRRARPHLRPALRTCVPAWPRRGKQWRVARTRCDLPSETRRRRQQGRHHCAPAACRQTQWQAYRLRRRWSGLADGRARSCAAGLPGHRVRWRGQGRWLHPHADPALPPARVGHRRGDRLHPRSRRRIPQRRAHRLAQAVADAGLRRDLRRLRRAARPRSRPARTAGLRGEHPYRHRLAGLGLLRPCRHHRSPRHRARRRQYRDGLLPFRPASRRRRGKSSGALGFRRDEGFALGKGRRAA